MKKKESIKHKINDEFYSVVINRKKIKNTYIRIDNDYNIVVNTNVVTTIQQIKTLILKHQDKIEKMVHNKKHQSLLPHEVSYLGKIYQLKLIENQQFFFEIKEDQIIFYSPFSLESTIDFFYKSEAQKILPDRLKDCFQHFCSIQSISYPVLSIRKMKSRYGTCYYTRNKINLNTYLIKYNLEIIDYVIYHELSHFIHHNHSKSFYQLLSLVNPNHSKIRKNIKKN